MGEPSAAAVPNGWVRTTLGELIVLQRGFDLPAARRRPGRYPVVSSGGVSGFHDRGPITGPGLAVGRAANLGVPVWSEGDYWPLNTTLFVKDFRGNDPRFVYYLLQQLDLSGYNSGSVQPMLTRNYVAAVPLIVPPPAEQRLISKSVRGLEDKIESDQRVISIASGLLDAISSSFAFGGRSVPLSALTEAVRDTFSPGSLEAELIDHFSIPAFDVTGLPDRTTGDSVISTKLRVDQPSVLVSRLNPKTNRTWFAVPEPGVTAGCSTEFLVLKPRAGVTLGSLWLAVRDEGYRSRLAQRVTGTSGSHQRVKPQDALDTDVPDVRQLSTADVAAADELLSLVHQRRIETTRLALLRDGLLPELLSGRIRVPEVL